MAITTYAGTSDLACTVLDADVAEKLIERASLMVTRACGTAIPRPTRTRRAWSCA